MGESKLEKNRKELKTNYDNTSEFLKAAISNLTGNITLLDTKISIILATVGVVLGLIIACKSNVLKAYYFFANNYFFKVLFLFLSGILIIGIIMTFAFGIKCIMIRFGKSKSSSLFFFNTETYGGISERDYMQKIIKMSDEEIMKNLADEVYKLNTINNQKMRAGKITITLFAITCAVIAALMILVGIKYLVV